MCFDRENVRLILAVQEVMSYSYRLAVTLAAIDEMDEELIRVQVFVPVPPLPEGRKESPDEHRERVKTKIREQLALTLSERPGTGITEIQVSDPQGNPVRLKLEEVLTANVAQQAP